MRHARWVLLGGIFSLACSAEIDSPPAAGAGGTGGTNTGQAGMTPAGASGKVYGFVYSGFDLGSAILPLTLGWLLDRGEPRAVFVAVAAVLLLTIVTEGVPEVPKKERVQVVPLGEGFYGVVAYYGFMQTPNVPQILRACGEQGLQLAPEGVSYYLGRETVLPTGRTGLSRWRKSLFALLQRNARPANAFFRIPPNRVVELGAQVEL